MEWAQILVIILGVFLALFLLLGIALLVMLLQVTRRIKHAAETAQKTVDHISQTVERGGRIIAPTMVLRTIAKLFRRKK